MNGFAGAPVRTAARPMAFTSDELLRGGITVWIIFMTLLCGAEAVHMGILLTAPGAGSDVPVVVAAPFAVLAIMMIAGFVSAIVAPVGLLLVVPVARAMSRVRARSLHVAVYTAIGGGIGWLYVAAFGGGQLPLPLTAWNYFIMIPAISAAVAVPLGWWWTSRRALRIDAGLIRPRRRRPDPDAAHEDLLTDIREGAER